MQQIDTNGILNIAIHQTIFSKKRLAGMKRKRDIKDKDYLDKKHRGVLNWASLFLFPKKDFI